MESYVHSTGNLSFLWPYACAIHKGIKVYLYSMDTQALANWRRYFYGGQRVADIGTRTNPG